MNMSFRKIFIETGCPIEEDTEEEEIKTFNTIANKDEILQMYLKDIGKIKLLNRTNEATIGKTIKEGGKKKLKLQEKNLSRQI